MANSPYYGKRNLARLQIRKGTYRGESGHHLTGKDSRGRQVKVFVPGHHDYAKKAKANLLHGRGPFDA